VTKLQLDQLYADHPSTILSRSFRYGLYIALCIVAAFVVAYLMRGKSLAAIPHEPTLQSALPSWHEPPPAAARASLDTGAVVHTNASPSAQTSQQGTSLTVNGQSVDVPQNGEVHQTISQDNGTTSIDVSQNSSGNAASSSLNVSIQSNSSSQEDVSDQ